MDPNIQLGLQLLLVGMVSVFFILGIVIIIGKVLIFVANKFAPEPSQSIMPQRVSSNGKHIAAITAVVETVTQGRGSIASIKKM